MFTSKRSTNMYAVRAIVRAPEPEPDYVDESYEDEPVVIKKRKKKNKRLPGERLLKQLYRERQRESIKQRLKEITDDLANQTL